MKLDVTLSIVAPNGAVTAFSQAYFAPNFWHRQAVEWSGAVHYTQVLQNIKINGLQIKYSQHGKVQILISH